jgi:hydrogenase expression/formation protein HypC
MCLGVPMRVMSIEGDLALCEIDGVRREASLMMVDGIEAGDYVIIHAGFAISKLDEADAEETLRVFRELLDQGVIPE